MRQATPDPADIANRGVQRVVLALEDRPIDRELCVFHVNGRLERLTRQIEEWGRDYAIIQYSLRRTQKPSTADWLPVWRAAKVVWSYTNLEALCAEDGVPADFAFYHAPLGLSDAFTREPAKKLYLVATHGTYLTESVKECVVAADVAERLTKKSMPKVVHFGVPFEGHDNVLFAPGVSDEDLAEIYRSCHYVSGLRRDEGFELPAAEGLACGARPILFHRPDYVQWYGEHAEYIIETDRPGVIDQLREVFTRRRPVAAAESAWAREHFNWDRIISGFYARL